MRVWTTLYASSFVLWRGSQGKPIEARLANDHIKYLHRDCLVLNTKKAEAVSRERERRRVCRDRGKTGGVALGTCGGIAGVWIGFICKG